MKTLSLLLSTFFCVLMFSATAQSPEKLNFYLKSYLQQHELTSPNKSTPLFVKGDAAAIKRYANANGGLVKGTVQGMVSIALPVSAVRNLAQQPYVDYIEFTLAKGQPMNDTMLVRNNVIPVHQGIAPLAQAYSGEDVVVGFIDTGIEVAHGDFIDSLGNTRIMYIWDQTESDDTARIPAQYGYGKLWDSTDINLGICTHLDESAHGSTVTGSAVSNAGQVGAYLGVAPKADIIAVESDFNAPNWTSTVADAVDFIFAMADSLGKPCVINASIGTYSGSHDGRDAAAKFIDSLILAKRGRVLVSAGGNSGGFVYHLGHDVTTDTSFTWFQYNSNSGLGYGAVFFEAWADTSDLNNVSYAVGADKVSGGYSFRGLTDFVDVAANAGNLITDTIENSNGDIIGIVDFYAELQGDLYLLQVHMAQPDSNAYNFRFMTTGAGHFDVWSASWLGTSNMISSGLPTAAQLPEIVYYKLPDDLQTIVSSWNCSPHVIAVANYYNRVDYLDIDSVLQTVPGIPGTIVATSSEGPTRDNRIKPDIAATGNIAISTCSIYRRDWFLANNQRFKVGIGGWHARNGGTSMASPVVAGIAALYLDKCPTASNAEIMEAVTATANQDGNTGATPNNTWGYGKVNGHNTVSYAVFEPLLMGDTTFCDGDSIMITAPAGYASYTWSSGDSLPFTYLHQTDSVLVVAVDSAGCIGTSGYHHAVENPNPATPIVGQVADTLTSSPENNYQWYLNGAPIGGATGQTHVATQSGSYFVEVTNVFGCTAVSDTLYHSITDMHESLKGQLSIYPNPSSGLLYIGSEQALPNTTITIMNMVGETVLIQHINITAGNSLSIDLSSYAGGVYLVHLQNETYKGKHLVVLE